MEKNCHSLKMRHLPAFATLLAIIIIPLGITDTTERECKCILNNLYLDVYLLVDVSEQMGTAGLLEVGSNVNSVFGYSQIRVGGPYSDGRGARVGVITYASQAHVLANLSDFQSSGELTNAVYGLKPEKDGSSNLQSSLAMVQQMLKLTDSPRNNTRTVIIIYAADYLDTGKPTIEYIGNQLKAAGVIIITVSDITRNDHQQIQRLIALASPGNGFSVNDDYPSEEVQQAMCRANCFCPPMYDQFTTTTNGKVHAYGSCVRYEMEKMSWTKAKLQCQNIHKQGHLTTEYSVEKHNFNRDLFKKRSQDSSNYHVGLHFVNGGYFWEQSTGQSLVALTNPLYILPSPPPTTAQCVADTKDGPSDEELWKNENCFTDMRAALCEVAACDTENFCA